MVTTCFYFDGFAILLDFLLSIFLVFYVFSGRFDEYMFVCDNSNCLDKSK